MTTGSIRSSLDQGAGLEGVKVIDMNSRRLWSRFSADPRAHGQVRASDVDRAVVTDVLSEAYALGQIDAEEFDERIESANRLKTLGEIPELVQDLVIIEVEDEDVEPRNLDEAARAQALARLEADRVPITPKQITAAAQRYYKHRVRRAVLGLVAGPAGITLAIWAITSIASGTFIFFWPLFVMIPMLLGLFTRIGHKDEIIRHRKRELTRRARATLGDAEAQRQLDAAHNEGEESMDPYADDARPLSSPGMPPLPPQPFDHPFAAGRTPRSRDEHRRRQRERRSRHRDDEDFDEQDF